MNLINCMLFNSDCYRAFKSIKPHGVMVHSTGANNPNIKRYVQPSTSDLNRSELLRLLGQNNNGNHWNQPGIDKCVHAFIGKLADGSIATVKTLPWNTRGWHCGKSGNNTHISFEICEDNLQSREYFESVWREAVELTAYLCERYDLDPSKPGVVVDHAEGYKLGIASQHADIQHWSKIYGKTMDDFRAEVIAKMNDGKSTDVFKDAKDWAISKGVFKGDGTGNYEWERPITRQEVAQVLYNVLKDKI